MGTPCYIAKEVGPDQYRTIFCQLDGYLEHNGALLAGIYDTEEMLDKILDLGDVYSLQAKLDPDPSMPHEFLNTQKGVTVFFGRDYGETGREATIMTMDELMENDPWCEFMYIYKPEEGWEFYQYGAYEELGSLKDALDRYGIKYRPDDQDEDTVQEQSDDGEEEVYEQTM